MRRRRDAGEGILNPADLLALGLNLLFALFSFLNLSKVRTTVLGLGVDRELLMGLVFLLLAPGLLLAIRFVNPTRGRVAHFLRLCYPQALYALWFAECIWLSQLFFDGRSLDRWFADLDRLIFGFQPAVRFSEVVSSPPITELFFFAYFFFYALFTSGVWFLYWRGRYREAQRFLFLMTGAFAVLALWYVFFPVRGPKYYFEDLHRVWYGNFRGYLFTWLMKDLFSSTNLGGAAFPSSHVALSLIALGLNWRYNRALVPAYAVLTAMLMASTVYLYAHYFVDVLAGAVVALPLYLLVRRLYRPALRLAARAGVVAGRLGVPPLASGLE